MGDVAEILGFNQSNSSSQHSNALLDEANKILNDKPKGLNAGPKNAKKPKGMSREVFSLLGADGLVPTAQGNKQVTSFKSKRSSAVRGKWIWAPFTNSARNDNVSFYHWVKADIQYADYPYAKFNLSLDPIQFTDDEYMNMLQSKSWTKEETMHILELASKYSLRWPVIADRYELEPYKTQEDIQARYYTILSRLRDHRIGITSSSNDFARDDHQLVFNLEQEKRRKYQIELAYRKTRDEEVEEQQLREEMKCIDILLKKAKKVSKTSNATRESVSSASAQPNASGLNIDTSSSISSYSVSSTLPAINAPSAAMIHTSSDINSDNHHIMTEASSSGQHVAPVKIMSPQPGRPMLQSSRLIVNETSLSLPRPIIRRVNTLLQDLGAPEHPLPTRTVCDMYDQIRQEAVSLAALHAAIHRREAELAAYRMVEKNTSSYESFSRDIIMPHGAMIYKLPHANEVTIPPTTASTSTMMPPSSPSRLPILNPHEYTDLVSTLGVALLSVDVASLGDVDANGGNNMMLSNNAAGGKKVAKRKSTGSDGGVDGGIDGTGMKKPAPKRSRPKPKVEGGMDASAIAAAAAAAVAGGILNPPPDLM